MATAYDFIEGRIDKADAFEVFNVHAGHRGSKKLLRKLTKLSSKYDDRRTRSRSPLETNEHSKSPNLLYIPAEGSPVSLGANFVELSEFFERY
ncbi:hypothetical protein ACOME3_002351 [Neoechinorhynchus agilis]